MPRERQYLPNPTNITNESPPSHKPTPIPLNPPFPTVCSPPSAANLTNARPNTDTSIATATGMTEPIQLPSATTIEGLATKVFQASGC